MEKMSSGRKETSNSNSTTNYNKQQRSSTTTSPSSTSSSQHHRRSRRRSRSLSQHTENRISVSTHSHRPLPPPPPPPPPPGGYISRSLSVNSDGFLNQSSNAGDINNSADGDVISSSYNNNSRQFDTMTGSNNNMTSSSGGGVTGGVVSSLVECGSQSQTTTFDHHPPPRPQTKSSNNNTNNPNTTTTNNNTSSSSSSRRRHRSRSGHSPRNQSTNTRSSSSRHRPRPPPPKPLISTTFQPPTILHQSNNTPHHNPTVTVRPVDLANRTAFERQFPLTPPELLTQIQLSSDKKKYQRKLSPALNHTRVLDLLFNQTTVRQLKWDVAIHPYADPWLSTPSSSSSNNNKNNPHHHHHDPLKIYTPTSPQSHRQSLPSHPPLLSNRKRRLPLRSDVGFPRATEDDIRKKQAEIQREAEHEECSPRLAVLIETSDVEKDVVVVSSSSKQQQQQQQKRNPTDESSSSQRWSLFAPPMDASRSSTQEWRPRPFSDRPSGMMNLLCSVVDVAFDVGDVEPLVGSLALYYLDDGGVKGKLSEDFIFPAGDWGGRLDDGETVERLIARQLGRMGGVGGMMMEEQREDDWGKNKGLETPRRGNAEGREEQRQQQQAWRKKKTKALFSYDPLALPTSSSSSPPSRSLYFVIQLFKVAQDDDAASLYGASRRSSDSMGGSMSETTSTTSGVSSSISPMTPPSSSVVSTTKSTPNFKRKLMSSRKKLLFKSSKTIGGKSTSPVVKQPVGGNNNSNNTNSSSSSSDKNRSSSSTSSSPINRSQKMFETYGTQFLTPLGFGLAPLISSSSHGTTTDDDESSILKWPKGDCQSISLYAYPSNPMSHEEFMDRLMDLVTMSSSSTTTTATTTSQSGDVDITTHSGSTRKMTTTKKSSSSSSLLASLSPPLDNSTSSPLLLLSGSATLFFSILGTDFTQVMLHVPTPLQSPSSTTDSYPRLLVDVTSDGAIMMMTNTDAAKNKHQQQSRKRSNLVRLPPSIPAGFHSSWSDVKEVLYLPLRGGREWDEEVPTAKTSFLNLLYLYPRALSFLGGGEEQYDNLDYGRMSYYSVRTRLIRQGVEMDEGTGGMEMVDGELEVIYNPAPGGRGLLRGVYTTIHPLRGEQQRRGRRGTIPLRDEIKMRLPTVLDGSFYLQFSLYAIEFLDDNDGLLTAKELAATKIPLSHYSHVTFNKDSSSTKVKVTTVIPNGLHRIKLGNYQLQVETRLASSIHVSDPMLAVLLRDLPFQSSTDDEETTDGSSSSGGMAMVSSFVNGLKMMSAHCVVHHFHVVMMTLLSRLLGGGSRMGSEWMEDLDTYGSRILRHGDDRLYDIVMEEPDQHRRRRPSSSTEILMETAKGILYLLQLLKMKYGAKTFHHDKLYYFWKDFCDTFDESLFSMQSPSPNTNRLDMVMVAETNSESSRGNGNNNNADSKALDKTHSFASTDFTPEKQLQGMTRILSTTGSNSSPSSPLSATKTRIESQMEDMSDVIIDKIQEKLLEGAVKVVAQHYHDSSSSVISQNNNARSHSLSHLALTRSSSGLSHYTSHRSIATATRSTGFSRRAYGVSTTQRMMIQAELDAEKRAGGTAVAAITTARFVRLWQDDETVMSTDTFNRSVYNLQDEGSEYGGGGGSQQPLPWDMNTAATGIDDNDAMSLSIGHLTTPMTTTYHDDDRRVSSSQPLSYRQKQKKSSPPPTSSNSNFSERAKSIRNKLPHMPSFTADSNIAKRASHVAQVMIGPCMAPSLSTVLQTPSTEKTTTTEAGYSVNGGSHDVVSSPAAVAGTVTTTVIDATPGSDVEEELAMMVISGGGESSNAMILKRLNFAGCSPYGRPRGSLKVLASSSVLECSLRRKGGDGIKGKGLDGQQQQQQQQSSLRPFLYEIIFAIWLQSWIDDVATTNQNDDRDKQQQRGSLFAEHVDLLLPLCLKSIVLRCHSQNIGKNPPTPYTFFDARQMHIIVPLVDVWVNGVMTAALSSEKKLSDDCDDVEPLPKSLRYNDVITDFFIGLLAVIHPAQVSILIERYFEVLSDYDVGFRRRMPPQDQQQQQLSSMTNNDEDDNDGETTTTNDEAYTPTQLLNLFASRHLRLRMIQKLAVIPRFIALNFPLKYPPPDYRPVRSPSSWTKQILERQPDEWDSGTTRDMFSHSSSPYPDRVERLPVTYWLSHLLASHCLVVCSLCCEAVVAEAVAAKKIKQQRDNNRSSSSVQSSQSPKQPSSERRRDDNDSETYEGYRGGGSSRLSKTDILSFQSMAIKSISLMYDHLVKRHAMDSRYQTEEARGRIASLFFDPIIRHSLRGVRWLSRLDAGHKVRCLWLLSFLYVLQEAPEFSIRRILRACCHPESFKLHKFIRLLKLSTSTFHSFIINQHTTKDENTSFISPWLVQESFNIICAITNTIVDECVGIILSLPTERKKMAQGILDLLLHVVTSPQSSVTHLRALGGASQALDKFGATLFLDVVGDDLQHWCREILTLMNSTSLSVRSIAVDFTVSLLGSVFDEIGNIDEISLVFLTVMPEVVAREIGLYSVSDQIESMEDVECALWPLRRAIADVEEASPIDDNRVDVQLAPLLGVFCRTCQAVIDGVLIELRLMGSDCDIVGKKLRGAGQTKAIGQHVFDADEESLYEAANFFLPETGPLQRLRWLLSLKSLHEAKGQWVEAAETLLLCARTIADAIPHVKGVWRPSRFVLWHDVRRSKWLATIGNKRSTNEQVANFADGFLEPPNLLGNISSKMVPNKNDNKRLYQPSVAVMCKLLTTMAKEAVAKYLEEDGMESLAFLRLEQLLKIVMEVVEDHGHGAHASGGIHHATTDRRVSIPVMPIRTLVEENAALRKMSASLNGDMTKIAERMLLLAGESVHQFEEGYPERSTSAMNNDSPINSQPTRHFYVRVILLGKKPNRFMESTTIPTYLEWENPSICRVPKEAVLRAFSDMNNPQHNRSQNNISPSPTIEDRICKAFAEPILLALSQESPLDAIILSTEMPSEEALDGEKNQHKTFVVVTLVHMAASGYLNPRKGDMVQEILSTGGTKRFFFRNKTIAHQNSSMRKLNSPTTSSRNYIMPGGGLSSSGLLTAGLTELTVGQRFPCALSRQRTIITSEYYS